MGIDEHQRGERDGYSGIHHAPARSVDEALGRAAGADRREFERQVGAQGSPGYRAAALPLRFVPIAIGFVLAFLFGVRLSVLALLAVAIGALALSPTVRRVLPAALPIYVGAAIGLALSALSLMGRDAPLIADNLVIFPMLGAGAGLLIAVVRYLRGRATRSK